MDEQGQNNNLENRINDFNNSQNLNLTPEQITQLKKMIGNVNLSPSDQQISKVIEVYNSNSYGETARDVAYSKISGDSEPEGPTNLDRDNGKKLEQEIRNILLNKESTIIDLAPKEQQVENPQPEYSSPEYSPASQDIPFEEQSPQQGFNQQVENTLPEYSSPENPSNSQDVPFEEQIPQQEFNQQVENTLPEYSSPENPSNSQDVPFEEQIPQQEFNQSDENPQHEYSSTPQIPQEVPIEEEEPIPDSQQIPEQPIPYVPNRQSSGFKKTYLALTGIAVITAAVVAGLIYNLVDKKDKQKIKQMQDYTVSSNNNFKKIEKGFNNFADAFKTTKTALDNIDKRISNNSQHQKNLETQISEISKTYALLKKAAEENKKTYSSFSDKTEKSIIALGETVSKKIENIKSYLKKQLKSQKSESDKKFNQSNKTIIQIQKKYLTKKDIEETIKNTLKTEKIQKKLKQIKKQKQELEKSKFYALIEIEDFQTKFDESLITKTFDYSSGSPVLVADKQEFKTKEQKTEINAQIGTKPLFADIREIVENIRSKKKTGYKSSEDKNTLCFGLGTRIELGKNKTYVLVARAGIANQNIDSESEHVTGDFSINQDGNIDGNYAVLGLYKMKANSMIEIEYMNIDGKINSTTTHPVFSPSLVKSDESLKQSKLRFEALPFEAFNSRLKSGIGIEIDYSVLEANDSIERRIKGEVGAILRYTGKYASFGLEAGFRNQSTRTGTRMIDSNQDASPYAEFSITIKTK